MSCINIVYQMNGNLCKRFLRFSQSHFGFGRPLHEKSPASAGPLYNVASSCSAPCSSSVISVMVCSGVTTGTAPFSKVSTSAS